MVDTRDEDCPMHEPIDDLDALSLVALKTKLLQETDERRRAQCMAKIQSHAVQLALDLLVRAPDPDGFFRVLLKALLDQTESQSCGVFLLNDDDTECELWMAYVGEQFYARDMEGIDTALPGREMSAHLLSYRPAWEQTVEYSGDDPRLPESVRAFNRTISLLSLAVVPLKLPTRNLGFIALSTGDAPVEYGPWRRATLEAIARQATLALHQSRLAAQNLEEARRQAVLEERNRIARDIHDNLAQGFAAILMQLQAVQRSAPSLPPQIAKSIDNAVELARTRMIEARRSVGALRPDDADAADVVAGLKRTAELARKTTDVPIELVIETLPSFGAGVEREVLGIAQEALTNAVRHSRAKKIRVHATSTRSVGLRLSVADDGRGIAKEQFGAGFGLTSMQERAERIGGSLTIVTAPRCGTEVVLAWEPPAFSLSNS
jgi:signal transduction histidine kinase